MVSGGKSLIKVSDDGSGISPDDIEVAFRKHTTRKIVSIDDVYSLHTFGFRGEALASIASVSRMEVISNTYDEAGEDEGKGRLIEINVRNNKDIRKLEGRIRLKPLSPTKSKIGVFIDTFSLTSEFLNLLGGGADLILQRKISEMLRNIEKICKIKDLQDFL